MTRKESEKDTERPHYYSQFWLDVAAGRRVIGSPKVVEESEAGERESPESAAARKSARTGHSGAADGREEPGAQPSAAQAVESQEQETSTAAAVSAAAAVPTEVVSEAGEQTVVREEEIPTIEVEEELEGEGPAEETIEALEAAGEPEASEAEAESESEEEPEEEPEPDYEEEDYEEEEDLWPGGKGKKKKMKPGRQVRPPKRSRRDIRRSY
jgi:hypothetical protein